MLQLRLTEIDRGFGFYVQEYLERSASYNHLLPEA
jgi:hypothetical protein